MTMAPVRISLVLLAASIATALPDHLLGQESRSPMDALLTYVEENVRMAVPPEMRPFEARRIFLRLDAGISGRTDLGPVDRGAGRDVPVTLLDDTVTFDDVIVRGPAGAHVRDDGVFVTVSAVDREADGRIGITFSYFVTIRRTGRRPNVCWEERRIVLAPPAADGGDWDVLQERWMGGC